jgi:DNA-binding IclR family transcriptional regulator
MVLHADVDLHVDMTLEALTFLAGMTAKTATNSLRTLREVGLVAKCDGGGWELR